MPDRFVAIIGRPNRDNLPLDVQGSFLRGEALDAMRQLGEVKAETLRLTDVTDSGAVSVGGTYVGAQSMKKDATLVTLWQHNMIATRFTADGKATSLENEWSSEIDVRRGYFESAHVEPDLL